MKMEERSSILSHDSAREAVLKSHDTTLEEIDWDQESVDYQRNKAGEVPGAKYGPVSESIRHTVAEHRACAMFCGGTKCKYCNPAAAKWTEAQMEVKGLFSNWVTGNILATSRPTTKAIKDFSIIEQFKQMGITSIINLQLPGEHKTCGFGNEPEGFSYSPQLFMDNDVFFYNFGWQDYGVGSLSNLLDMVKVMQFALSEGKVAIHCHAGLGRTGVLIACYLVYANRMEPHEVIHFIRSKRHGAIQTRGQITCIEEFAAYLKPLRTVFSSVDPAIIEFTLTWFLGYFDEVNDPAINEFTLTQFMTRQKQILHGEEARHLKLVPKIVFCCCERLLELAHRGRHHDFHNTVDTMMETAPLAFHNRSSSQVMGQVTLQHSLSSQESVTSSKHVLKHIKSESSLFDDDIQSFTAVPMRRSNSQTSTMSLSDGSLLGTPTDSEGNLEYIAADQYSQAVAQAMAAHSYSGPILDRVHYFKELMNTDSDAGYRELFSETDPLVVSALMWQWLDELREPVLHPQDMPTMLQFVDDPITGLKKLQKGARGTMECVFSLLSRLEPMSTRLLEDSVCRALSTLTHQNMILDLSSMRATDIRRTANQSGIMRQNLANKLLVFSMGLLSTLEEKLKLLWKQKKEKQLKNKPAATKEKKLKGTKSVGYQQAPANQEKKRPQFEVGTESDLSDANS